MAQPFDEDIDLEDEGTAPEESQNRTFVLVAVGLGGLFIVGLICIGLYAFLVAPAQRAARDATAAAIIAQNTQVAIDAANTANPSTPTPPATDTPVAIALATSAATDTPVIPLAVPSDTPTITNTPGPSPTPSRTPTRIVRIVTATFTRGPGTGLPSGVGGGGETQVPTATPTGLPNTGFADDVGGPGLFVAAIVLVAVLVLVRRLRLQNA